QRDITETLQTAIAILGRGRFQRLGQHDHQRLQAGAFRGLFKQRLGAREQREEIDYVVLGLVFDSHLLLFQGTVELVLEELPQIGDRYYTRRGMSAWHDDNGLQLGALST